MAARSGPFAQHDVTEPAPAGVAGHLEALMGSPPAAPFVAEGWDVALVDLAQVVAVQPVVHVDRGLERLQRVPPNDLDALIAITLPLPADAQLPAQFDPHQRAWMISSPNLNLRILGHWAAPAEPGLIALGFTVGITPSYMQVARYRGRYLLRDGYHRAVALLQRGITKVPAFTREFGAFEELGLPGLGLLPPAAYLGDHPPLLPDYLNDEVATDVQMPAGQKLVVINGLELNSAA